MNLKIISYFCDVDPNDTYYSDHAKMFIKNMQDLNMDFYIEEIASQGSYRANCLFKPGYILKCMEKFKQPVLWLDIDSYVHKKLDMFDNVDVDVIFATNSIDKEGKFIPKASPIYFSQSEKSYKFLNKWISSCNFFLKNDKKFFDHEIMLEVLKEEDLTVALFGKNFCLFANDFVTKDAVITMGISAGPSKIKGLKDMGHTDQSALANANRNTYYTRKGIIR
jgi:hypothetical protein